MRDILTPAELAASTGWHVQRIQSLCRSGKLKATNVSSGDKKPRYIIRRCDWEAFLDPDAELYEKKLPADSPLRRTRLDANVRQKVL